MFWMIVITSIVLDVYFPLALKRPEDEGHRGHHGLLEIINIIYFFPNLNCCF